MAGRQDGAPTEEHEPDDEPGADRRVVPVEPCGDDLRLADRPRLRADELDLVARAAARECPDDLDLIAAVHRVVHGHRARHAVVGRIDLRRREVGHELLVRDALLGVG